MQQLIDSNTDLSKPDIEGNTLLDAVLNLPDSYLQKNNMFRNIANYLKESLSKEDKFSYLMKIVNQTDLIYLIYATREGWIKECASDFENFSQLLCNLKDPDGVSFLCDDKGFDINLKNSNGMTPLLYLLYKNGVVRADILEAFIKSGANLKAKTILDGEIISVEAYLKERNPTPEIRALLEKK